MTIYRDKQDFFWDCQWCCQYLDQILKYIKQEHEETLKKQMAAETRALFWATSKKKIVSIEKEAEYDIICSSFSLLS